MAHFYGMIQGNRGQASRCGSKKSGLCGVINGWNEGIEVIAIRQTNGEDLFLVGINGGSNKKHETKTIFKVKNDRITLFNGLEISTKKF